MKPLARAGCEFEMTWRLMTPKKDLNQARAIFHIVIDIV
jgi:hypothetical protein